MRGARRVHGMPAGQAWEPVLDSLGIVNIVVAFFVFFYFMVGYKFLPEFWKPSYTMALMLLTGVFGSYALVRYKVYPLYYNMGLAVVTSVSLLALIAAEWLGAALTGNVAGAQGVVLQMNPLWLGLFFYSVGVAEEALFTLLLFGGMVRSGVPMPVALVVKSAAFVSYHIFASFELYGRTIYQVPPYSFMIFFGSMVITVAFYYTRAFSVPSTAHGLLNFVVKLGELGVLR